MRVFSGEFYKSVWALIGHLGITADKRRFLFAYSNDDDRPYYIHPSNLHRFPPILAPFRSTLQNFLAFVNLLFLSLCYIYFTLACHLVPPKVRDHRKGTTDTETLEEYAKRIHLPTPFLTAYVLPLFSSVASCSHEQFLNFPAFYVTNYKRLTQGATHCTVPNMAEVEARLSAGLDVRVNTMVQKVERGTQGLAVTVSDRASGAETVEWFDNVVLAISPKAIGRVWPRSRWLVDQLVSSDVGVLIHNDQRAIEHLKSPATAAQQQAPHPSTTKQNLNPYPALNWLGDSSETLTVRTRACANNTVHITEATHVHPSGALITVWPKHADVDGDWSTTTAGGGGDRFHEVSFCRVAATVQSSYALAEALDGHRGSVGMGDQEKRWRNGDDGVFVAGGWAWQGLALLEGCVRSGRVAAEGCGARCGWM